MVTSMTEKGQRRRRETRVLDHVRRGAAAWTAGWRTRALMKEAGRLRRRRTRTWSSTGGEVENSGRDLDVRCGRRRKSAEQMEYVPRQGAGRRGHRSR